MGTSSPFTPQLIQKTFLTLHECLYVDCSFLWTNFFWLLSKKHAKRCSQGKYFELLLNCQMPYLKIVVEKRKILIDCFPFLKYTVRQFWHYSIQVIKFISAIVLQCKTYILEEWKVQEVWMMREHKFTHLLYNAFLRCWRFQYINCS